MCHQLRATLTVCGLAVATVAPGSIMAHSGRHDVHAMPTSGAPWVAPRTVDGHPDLQGIWVNNSATPLERPKEVEGRASLTDTEVSALRKRAATLLADANGDFLVGGQLFVAAWHNLQHYDNPNATAGSDAIAGTEFDNRTSLITDPADGMIPPLTDAGQKRLAAAAATSFLIPWQPGSDPFKQHSDAVAAEARRRPPAGPEDLTNGQRCITWGVPKVGGNLTYMSHSQILQTPGYVMLLSEVNHERRIVPLDGRPHLPASIRQWDGDARGRWEGDVLVVDTRNFAAGSYFMGSAEELHLIERFTRVTPDMINYEITVDDPTTWTRSWTALIRLKRSAEKLYEFACHEGNYYVISGILGGARADENKAVDATATGDRR